MCGGGCKEVRKGSMESDVPETMNNIKDETQIRRVPDCGCK